MFLKINDDELELKYSFRINVFYEQIQGHSADFTMMTSNDLMTLFFCTVLASLQKAKKPIISMEEFMDIVDDNGGEKCIVDFTEWYVKVVQAQYEMLNMLQDPKETKNVKAKKKKN